MLTVHLTRIGTTWEVCGDHIRTVPPILDGAPKMQVTLPNGYITDLDSVPRIPLFYTWLKNRTAAAAVWHDYFYRSGYPRKWADAQFLADMNAEGVKKRYRVPIYWGVRLFGSRYHAETPINTNSEHSYTQVARANDTNEGTTWNGEKNKN